MNKTLTLSTGAQMPTLGLGTWRAEPHVVGEAVEFALTKAGYKHLDCASVYGNEAEIGEALQRVYATGITREEIYITSKLWNTHHHPDHVLEACQRTLRDLQLEYLDLYLIHWGIAFAYGQEKEVYDQNGTVVTELVPLMHTWHAMEKLVTAGLVKAIGVANFTTPMLLDMLSYAHIPPVNNQIEVHPYNAQVGLVEFCQRHNITVTAYSPLGSFGEQTEKPLQDPIVTEIAAVYGKTPAQVLLRWCLQRGLAVIPKSTRRERIKENTQVYDFQLTAQDMERLTRLNKNHRFVNPAQQRWGIPYFE